MTDQEITVEVDRSYKIRIVSDCDGVSVFISKGGLDCIWWEDVETVEAREEQPELRITTKSGRKVTGPVLLK